MIQNFILVGMGGAGGSMLRYAIICLMPHKGGMPWATLIVNLLGCLVIGVLAGLAARSNWLSTQVWTVLATGFLGGFTTFSAFALDGVKLMTSGESFAAFSYLLLSMVGGIMLCYLSYHLTRI